MSDSCASTHTSTPNLPKKVRVTSSSTSLSPVDVKAANAANSDENAAENIANVEPEQCDAIEDNSSGSLLQSESSKTLASAALNEAFDISEADLNTEGIDVSQSDIEPNIDSTSGTTSAPDKSQECLLESESSSSSAYSTLLKAMDAESVPYFSYWCKNLAIPQHLSDNCIGCGTKRMVRAQLGPKAAKETKKMDLCDMFTNLCVNKTTVVKNHWVKCAQAKKSELQIVTESMSALEICQCKADTCLTCTVHDLYRLAAIHDQLTVTCQRETLSTAENLSGKEKSLSAMKNQALDPLLTADGCQGQTLKLRDSSVYSRGNTSTVGRFLVQAWIISAVVPAISSAVTSTSSALGHLESHPSLTPTLGQSTGVSTCSAYFKIFHSKAPAFKKSLSSSTKPRPRKNKQRSAGRNSPVPSAGTQRSIKQFFPSATIGPIRSIVSQQNGV